MSPRPTAWLWVILLLAVPATSLAQTSDELLARARRRFIDADIDGALQLLDRAKQVAVNDKARAVVELERGVLLATMEREPEAERAFRLALWHDSTLEIDIRQHKPATVMLFRRVRRSLRGQLRVTSDRPTVVFVDGALAGMTPYHAPLGVGHHHVVLQSKDHVLELKHDVVVPAERTVSLAARVDVPLQPPLLGRKRLWTWVAAAAGLATLAAGIGVGVAARLEHDEYQTTYDAARWRELRDSIPPKTTAANVLYGVGGALTLTAGVLFFVEGRSAARPRVEVGVNVSASGLLLRGAF